MCRSRQGLIGKTGQIFWPLLILYVRIKTSLKWPNGRFGGESSKPNRLISSPSDWHVGAEVEKMHFLFNYVYLNTEDAKDDEESTADQNNVADGLEGCDEGLNHQLQPRSSADYPGGRRQRCRRDKRKKKKREIKKKDENTGKQRWLNRRSGDGGAGTVGLMTSHWEFIHLDQNDLRWMYLPAAST